MFDANWIYHFRWRKKKSDGFIISADFFAQSELLQNKAKLEPHEAKNNSKPIHYSEIERVENNLSSNVAAEKSITNVDIIEKSKVGSNLDVKNKSESTEKTLLSTPSSNISAFSLSGIKAKKMLQEQSKPIQISSENAPTNDFTETQMLIYWNEYAHNLGNSGQKIMKSLLTISMPTLKNTVITLELPNQGSKIDFDAETPPLLRFLQQKLNNFSITINVEVNEQVEKKFAFTPEDRYERLKQINPNIDILRKMFELDFN